MNMRRGINGSADWQRVFATLVVAFGLAGLPGPASAQVLCPTTSTNDTDQDGFTDQQECDGIPLLDGTTFPGADANKFPAFVADRPNRLDPNSKDLFVIYLTLSSGHLAALQEPFNDQTFNVNGTNIKFVGLSALGITVHRLVGSQVSVARTVSSDPAILQKAVRIVESLSTDGDILGICQWGTPLGEDGCTVYTQRAKNFINKTCDAAKDTTTDRNQVFLAYATYLVLHEVGHSLGGLAADYNDRFGGYHYKAGSGVVMEQAAAYSTKGGTCTWYISNGWNLTLDPAAIRLK